MKKNNKFTLKTLFLIIIAFVVLLTIAFYVNPPEQDLEISIVNPGNLDLSTQENFDINQYTGLWYELARSDNIFERGCVCATQTLNFVNNEVNVHNWCRKNDDTKSEARFTFEPTNIPGVLRGGFFNTVNYKVLYVDEDYKNAIVSSNNGNMYWILTKDTPFNEATKQKMTKILEEKGFDTQTLIYNEGCY